MNAIKLSLCALLLVGSPLGQSSAQAQGRNMSGLIRRYQQAQQQQMKQMQAYQKAYQEWKVKADAEAAQKMAEHRADLARKKAKAEQDRLLRIEKNKQHNAELKSHEKPASRSDKSAKADAVKGEKSNADLEDPESGEKVTGLNEGSERTEKTSTKKSDSVQTATKSRSTAVNKKNSQTASNRK